MPVNVACFNLVCEMYMIHLDSLLIDRLNTITLKQNCVFGPIFANDLIMLTFDLDLQCV